MYTRFILLSLFVYISLNMRHNNTHRNIKLVFSNPRIRGRFAFKSSYINLGNAWIVNILIIRTGLQIACLIIYVTKDFFVLEICICRNRRLSCITCVRINLFIQIFSELNNVCVTRVPRCKRKKYINFVKQTCIIFYIIVLQIDDDYLYLLYVYSEKVQVLTKYFKPFLYW